jgi:hypothetical protein
MYITQKHLSRRAVLRGMGATMALPLLDAMVPAQTLLRKTAAAPRTRLACIELVHGSAGSTQDGIDKHYWMPATEGADFDVTMILKPLEPFRKYLTVVTQTDLRAAEAWSAAEEGADHFRSSAVFLTAAHPKQTDLRATVRPGHAVALAAARDRERGRERRLRLQLRVRLLGTHQLVVADHAHADDHRSPDGVRESVR